MPRKTPVREHTRRVGTTGPHHERNVRVKAHERMLPDDPRERHARATPRLSADQREEVAADVFGDLESMALDNRQATDADFEAEAARLLAAREDLSPADKAAVMDDIRRGIADQPSDEDLHQALKVVESYYGHTPNDEDDFENLYVRAEDNAYDVLMQNATFAGRRFAELDDALMDLRDSWEEDLVPDDEE